MLSTKIIMNGTPIGLATMAVTDRDYQALLDDRGEMLFEACSLEELESTYLYGKPLVEGPMFEAITTNARRLERTMKAFHRELTRQLTGTDIEASEAEISAPRVSGGFATQTARFPLSDGQSIGIIFHSPSGNPAKIEADDVLVAFRFMLNKRDVTPTVAPAGGMDVSLKQVTLKLSNLAERNSSKFQAKQDENTQKASELSTLQEDAEIKQAEFSQIAAEADQLEADAEKTGVEVSTYVSVVAKAENRVKALKAKLAALSKTEKVSDPEGGTATPPAGAMTPQDQKELEQFTARLKKDAADYNAMLTGDPRWAGFDPKSITLSIHNRVKTLHKNGKTAIVDGILEQIAILNHDLAKPLFTDRHSIWKLGSVTQEPAPETGKPKSPGKPEQAKATGETLTLVYYAQGASSEGMPKDAVEVLEGQVLQEHKEAQALMKAYAFPADEARRVLVFNHKLTRNDIERYNLIELQGATQEEKAPEGDGQGAADSYMAGGVDFSIEVSNLVSKHFGKTWHEIGLTDPLALKQIIGDDPRFDRAQMEEINARVDMYIADKKIADGQAVFGNAELHWYGLKARPLQIGASPKSQSVAVLTHHEAAAKFPLIKNSNVIRHGAVAYGEKLTDEVIAQFELVDLDKALAQAKGVELDENDFSYFMTEIMAEALNTYGDTNITFDLETAKSLISIFEASGPNAWFNKMIAKTFTFKNRKSEPDDYKKLVLLRDTVTLAQVTEAIMQYVPSDEVSSQDPAVTEIDASAINGDTASKLKELEQAQYVVPRQIGQVDATTPKGVVMPFDIKDAYDFEAMIDALYRDFETEGRFAALERQLDVLAAGGDVVDLMDADGARVEININGEVQKATLDDGADYHLARYVRGQISGDSGKRFDIYASSENPGTFTIKFGDDSGKELPAANYADAIEKVKEHFGLTDYVEPEAGADVDEGGDNDVSGIDVKSVVEKLEQALANETDSEALLDVLETAIDELEALNAYDENEALVEQVSDRVTELLSMEDAG